MNLTASMEDYLEAIWIEAGERKVVRVKNITHSLNVKTSSVIGALNILSDKGLIIHERYGYIELTSKGINLAKQIHKKHKILLKFFHDILGLDFKIAKEDACKMEHCIHKGAVYKLIKFIDFIESYGKGKDSFISKFRAFIKSGSNKSSKCSLNCGGVIASGTK